jgi:hypothetical protein
MLWFKKKKPQKPVVLDREALKAEALAHMRKARTQIGEDKLDRLAAMLKVPELKPASEGDKARDLIRSMDKDKIADNLRYMLRDKGEK